MTVPPPEATVVLNGLVAESDSRISAIVLATAGGDRA